MVHNSPITEFCARSASTDAPSSCQNGSRSSAAPKCLSKAEPKYEKGAAHVSPNTNQNQYEALAVPASGANSISIHPPIVSELPMLISPSNRQPAAHPPVIKRSPAKSFIWPLSPYASTYHPPSPSLPYLAHTTNHRSKIPFQTVSKDPHHPPVAKSLRVNSRIRPSREGMRDQKTRSGMKRGGFLQLLGLA